MVNLAENLEFWMTNLPKKLRTIPVIHLAIPGSHDSTTFNICNSSEVSPDAAQPVQYFKFLRPILCPLLSKWSKTQNIDIKDQLIAGIRYLDFRIALKSDQKDFYFVHNMYSERVKPRLEQINNFLDSHPDEIVILDCQHFFDMQDLNHENFISQIKTLFGAKLTPYKNNELPATLDSMKEGNFQVILIYRHKLAQEYGFWPKESFITPCAFTVDIPKLINFLNKGLELRNHNLGFVSQCILTPNFRYACRHIFGSLKFNCVEPLEEPKYEWLLRQTPGAHGLNVVISDFIEDNNFKFVREVVNLNVKLIDL